MATGSEEPRGTRASSFAFVLLVGAAIAAVLAFLVRASVFVEPVASPIARILAELLVVAVACAGALALPFLAFALRRRGTAALRGLLVPAASIASGLAGASIAARLDSPERAVRRVAPLVEALGRFERDRGRVPIALDELVPEYLSSIPATACPSYPALTYRPRSTDRYELQILCNGSIHGFEGLCYDPEQRYSEATGGSSRIGDWVHWFD